MARNGQWSGNLVTWVGDNQTPGGDGAQPGGDARHGAARALAGLRRAMSRWMPKTMAGLFGVGCLLVSAPLFVATIASGVALQRHAESSQQLVTDSLVLERYGAKLINELQNLERAGLQYAALEDDSLIDVIERRHAAAREIVRQIDRAGFPAQVDEHLRAIEAGLGAMPAAWTRETADVQTLSRAMAGMRRLQEEAAAMVDTGRHVIDARVRLLQADSARTRLYTRLSALALVPLVLGLAFAISAAVARPLRLLRSGMVALGTANYRQPVVIGYPNEMSRLGEKLDWLRRRLALLEADKERFLRHVSHELKTPLASIHEGTSLLREGTLGELTAAQAEVVQIVGESTAELDQQIRNLLAYAQWRNGRHQDESGWFDACALVGEVVAAHRLSIVKRRLTVDIGIGDRQQLFGQRPRLRVALDNLLSNAIKHAPSDSTVQITGGCRNGRCTLAVRDFGRGIAPGDRLRVLEPFVRGEEEEESGVRGTGVGLSIVVETVDTHGGELEVQDANPGTRMVMVWACPPARE